MGVVLTRTADARNATSAVSHVAGLLPKKNLLICAIE